MDLENPATLVTTGPYAFSPNPMYVGWTVLYLGFALIANTIWSFLVFPVVLATTHRQIRLEERTLEHGFGEPYRAYRRTVPRYL